MKNLPKNGKLPQKKWFESQPDREKRRKRKIRIAALASSLVMLSAAAAGWGWYHENRQGYDLLTSLMEVEVLSKGIDTSGEKGVYWLDVRVSETEEENIPESFRLPLGERHGRISAVGRRCI